MRYNRTYTRDQTIINPPDQKKLARFPQTAHRFQKRRRSRHGRSSLRTVDYSPPLNYTDQYQYAIDNRYSLKPPTHTHTPKKGENVLASGCLRKRDDSSSLVRRTSRTRTSRSPSNGGGYSGLVAGVTPFGHVMNGERRGAQDRAPRSKTYGATIRVSKNATHGPVRYIGEKS